MRRTKIVATLGPASNEVDIIKKLIKAGINAARFNFSHGDYEEHGQRIRNLKQAREELNAPIPIILDTKGPEIRTRDVEGGSVELVKGEKFTITTDDIVGDLGLEWFYRLLCQPSRIGRMMQLPVFMFTVIKAKYSNPDKEKKPKKTVKIRTKKRRPKPKSEEQQKTEE